MTFNNMFEGALSHEITQFGFGGLRKALYKGIMKGFLDKIAVRGILDLDTNWLHATNALPELARLAWILQGANIIFNNTPLNRRAALPATEAECGDQRSMILLAHTVPRQCITYHDGSWYTYNVTSASDIVNGNALIAPNGNKSTIIPAASSGIHIIHSGVHDKFVNTQASCHGGKVGGRPASADSNASMDHLVRVIPFAVPIKQQQDSGVSATSLG